MSYHHVSFPSVSTLSAPYKEMHFLFQIMSTSITKYFSFNKTAKPRKAKGKKHKICSLIKNPLKLSQKAWKTSEE